ncbi:LEAF RUST 10 DISEASE-RESISTANCE LOCUS RECEPTOR-LIKE PROTEIN KINASE-like 1.1 isoform X2 [Juglans microcarpa x Juglans regia]|uniref:LEAF RUST 10 DISEASE-RESISTANCE LOCUS RECEPTOR-LIKE PROTEIN KINASE-like 1.1 isoform X2 n=1 Tax=Juglans microcarpa x Juglans regia TaxID=2249226 RepID=UPI001B7E8E54|nr:LEAF RUST 10 DISEASE-RESISTANCE LOCUS RECEPTOR-LIKE PROTEIN KINASE-like 1.1 isoform X2 [Juglans microcarpa x Juglans regia]
MASVSKSSVFFLLSYLVLLCSAKDDNKECTKEFDCGRLGKLHFPLFSNTSNPDCGLFIKDCDTNTPKIQLGVGGSERSYEFVRFSPPNVIFKLLPGKCDSLTNLSLPSFPSFPLEIPTQNRTLYKCKQNHNISRLPESFKSLGCNNNEYEIWHSLSRERLPDASKCSIIQLPIGDEGLLKPFEFVLQVRWSKDCLECHRGGGHCWPRNGTVHCDKEKKRKWVIPLIAVGCSVLLISICLGVTIWSCYKKKHASSNLLARAITYSRSDLEGGSVYFGVPLFSYSELQEATNNFDIEKELGDGGFGTVYYGKLRDGREVAVKRLYEHNYKRVEQFMNEVEILTRLRHTNLVSLYGCTSRHSRELLLVYEYIPNGTVADHIHGDRATPGSLTWPTRMSIAIETANALAYLHASDIIHRDVKTNNILLDNNFSVKVADFGLSRLFPTDVTHVSTAPQGTPGYVDPEYHQCYQLTSKSDVYSFGVVLIELISSLTAVDIGRHRHEINLANLAINKIEKCAFHELIDPHLGFHSDDEVKRMTISVASLAFQCVQQDKELRPSMDEVLKELHNIRNCKDVPKDQEKAYEDAGMLNIDTQTSPDCDEVGLLKTKQLPPSPNCLTDNWTSRSTTPISSN